MGVRLLPGVFDGEARRWVLAPPAARVDRAPARLSVVTYNVWFADVAFHERAGALLGLLRAQDADVIALQEVTPALLGHILASGWVRESYAVSDIAGASVDPYGVLILSRLPVCEWRLLPLPSAMGRCLVTAALAIADTAVAAVHLESTRYAAPVRAKQLTRIFPALAAERRAVLVGDFNFCSSWDENRQLDPAYTDVWPALRPAEPGYTEDTAVNLMRARHSGTRDQVRFDRVLVRGGSPGWRPSDVRLLGTTPIAIALPDIFPSDHFGLRAELAWG